MDKARETALKILYKIDEENAYSNIVLNNEIKKQKENLNTKDISLISEIIYGVTTWKLTLDEKDIKMDFKYFKNVNISNNIFRQNTKISSS